jgi:hypothetical protein
MPAASAPLTPADEHGDCRLRQFSLWNRITLEHERAHISRALAYAAGFMTEAEYADLCHDVADIDWVLSFIDEPVRVKT